MKYIIKTCLWIVTFLVFLEIFLRAGGLLFTMYQSFKNRIEINQNEYRIICVGDSDTALGGDDSYPSLLQGYLDQNSSRIHFKVINVGIVASDSEIILNNIQKQIAEYKPNMAIVMMGINDRFPLHLKRKNQIQKFLEKSKVEPLVVSLWQKALNHFHNSKQLSTASIVEDPQKPVLQQEAMLLMYAIQLKEQGQYDQAESIFERLIALDLDKTFIDRCLKELEDCYFKQKKYEKLLPMIMSFLDKDPFELQSTDEIRSICLHKEAPHETTAMLTALVQKHPDNPTLNGLLGACLADYGNFSLSNQYMEKLKALTNSGENIITKTNYLKMHQILKQHGIKEIFIQYPNRDVRLLKEMFRSSPDEDNIVFVENQSNFTESLDPSKYTAFFKDRTSDNFGHGTRLGNSILAKRVGNAVLESLK